MDVRCPHSSGLQTPAVKGMLPLSDEACRLDQAAKVKLCELVGGTSLHAPLCRCLNWLCQL